MYSYHVLPGVFTSDELFNGKLLEPYVLGSDITVGVTNATATEPAVVKVNNATVTKADIVACNGVVHLIDEVYACSTGAVGAVLLPLDSLSVRVRATYPCVRVLACLAAPAPRAVL